MEIDNEGQEAVTNVEREFPKKIQGKARELENFDKLENIIQYIKREGPSDLQHFSIDEYIGRGSESLVFKIRLNKTNKCYGLKVIKKKKNKTNNNEFIISKKLKHKNIATVLCYYVDPKKDVDYILMELGHSNLSRFTRKTIKRSTLSETFLCFICYQTLEGLFYLHKNKIAHLDIKPQNLLINDYLEIKLIDFSVSLDYSNLKKEEEIKIPYVGTPSFISPEILERRKTKVKNLQKVDLFSLGVTLYALGFGRFPFDIKPEDEDEEIIHKLNSGWKVVDDNNLFSTHFINFLNGLLEIDINKRLTINQALNSYWVKGAEIILNEKENTYNANSFLSYLITDNIREFQNYIFKKLF